MTHRSSHIIIDSNLRREMRAMEEKDKEKVEKIIDKANKEIDKVLAHED